MTYENPGLSNELDWNSFDTWLGELHDNAVS